MKAVPCFFIPLSLLLGSFSCWAESTPLLSLQSALDRAIESNPQVVEARERWRGASASVGYSVASSLPQVGLFGSAQSKKDPLNLGNPAFGGEPYNFYDFNLKISQSLFSGGSLWASLSDAQSDETLRRLDLEILEREISLQVIQIYYRILLEQRNFAALEKSREVQLELFSLSKKKLNIGRAQVLDVLEIETQLALLEPKLSLARHAIRTAAAELAQLLGERTVSEFKVPDQLPNASLSLATQKLKRKTLPEFERAVNLRLQAEARRTITLSKYLPKLDAVGLLGRSSFVKNDLLDEYSTYWAVGLQLSIPILMGGGSFFERRQLNSVLAQAEIQELRIQDERILEQIKAKESFDFSSQNRVASEQAYGIAQKALIEAQKNYKLATLDYSQFFRIQQNALEAEMAFQRTKFDLLVSAARLCAASGMPVREWAKVVEAK